MMTFGETKIENKKKRQKFYGGKISTKIWDVDDNNMVISNLINTKTNSKYLIGYSNKTISPLVLILPKLSG